MKHDITIKELKKEERPYEKAVAFGVNSLTDVELLAVLLRTGTKGEDVISLARKLLYQGRTPGILGLHQHTLETLMNIKGIGKVKATQIICLLELTKRLSKAKAKEPLCFNNPDTIADYYMEELRHQSQEQMKLLLLNTKAALIGERNVSKGTVNASIITPRELFIEALLTKAVSIILLHNHPSGDPAPSREDIRITRRIKEAGDLIGIELLDHLIIGDNCYVSFRKEGLL
ncbi:MAG TPA: DNA repair protein RadC [Candidatus Dorea intestinavium]|nr:DNA repair protein RadC [Candidatus Dorea intestinavium]